VQAAVLAPFQLAFAPVALIASAAGAGGSMTFNPIAFDPGTADLNSTGRDMAAALARVLRERDKLKLRVCGRATAEDLAEALGEKAPPPAGPQRDQAVARLGGSLEALASDRTAEVRRALIEEGGAKPGQVGECRSAFDPDDTRPPRVEISF
jgi:outer membrane protein OmpA-like peptidoglycan-associated protein